MSIEAMKQVIQKLRIGMTDARQNESHFESWMILNEAICDSIDDLRQAIEQAQKQEPRQEAQIVNWNCPCGNTVTFRGFTQAPPPRQPWVGLTNEDKQIAFDDTQEGGGFWEFADAIEATLRKKNHG